MMAVKAHIVPAGGNGATYYADAVIHAGRWNKLTQTGPAPAVFSASASNITGLNGFTLALGQSIEGIFSSITLSSGSVIAYPA